MTTSQFTYLLPFVAAAITAVLGLAALIWPGRARHWYGIASHDLAMVRRNWGGGPLISAVFCLYWQAPSAFFGLGMAWLGIAATRLIQFRDLPSQWRPWLVEVGMAVSMLVGLVTG